MTREQIATILWRYLGSVEADSAVLAAYSDAARVSDYAVSAMSWACAAGIINGSDGALQPGGSATRVRQRPYSCESILPNKKKGGR